MQMSKTNWIISGLLAVILVLAAILIFRKPNTVTVVEPFDDTELREQIRVKDSVATYWESEAARWHSVADSAIAVSDSLETFKPGIKKHYDGIYKTIPDANVIGLDSIIRANW